MYRDRLEEIRKEKGFTNKRWSEESGVSIDTIARVIHPENPIKDSPRVNTLEDLCRPLGVELWEIFYTGDRSLVHLQAEINDLRNERDALVADNGALKDRVETLRGQVDALKDEVIDMAKKSLNIAHREQTTTGFFDEFFGGSKAYSAQEKEALMQLSEKELLAEMLLELRRINGKTRDTSPYQILR